MHIKKRWISTFNIHLILIIPIFLFTTMAANAVDCWADTSRKPLLAAIDKPVNINITREANVEFPELLKGNETQLWSYIENFSTRRREYIIRMHNKGKKLLPKAEAVLRKYGLPAELKVLLTLESAYNGNAVSGAGAVGYWQIMDEVAKEFGLKYTPHFSADEKKKMLKADPTKADSIFKAMAKAKDDRKNFVKSTHAAARYLRDRKRNLNNNWLLVVASYNCGVGNVWNAIERSGKPNASFWDIKALLPAETQSYVMNFITLNVLFHNYEKFAANQLRFSTETFEMPDRFEKIMTDAMDEWLK
ncbi:MAG: lytic transglycosylase domain-containing protein [Ferruginibacter sp.]